MSQEHHRGLFHHKKEEDNVNTPYGANESGGYNTTGGGYGATEGDYGSSDYQTGPGYNTASTYVEQTSVEYGREGEYDKAIKEEKHHKRMEHVGEFGTVAAGAYALYEKHEAKKDPENAHRHKIEEEVAAAAAVGSGGFAFHERHEKKEDKNEAEEAQGKKHHHLF
ncbi:hypothetical protein KI387_037889 [Taxus chinensis]|uniref:Uncharacterized protein n=1 Tax=Taxus chinensis TaxID=29808 RepID=A0AA38KUE3_TAXCH|nr:hypothetical protein KI387_037889 [Taxus chinensis]